MHIRALFFASYREILGTRELTVEVSRASTVEVLVRELRSRGEPFSRLPASPVVAVNREHAQENTLLRDGDEVAFLPPVAGG